MVDLLYVAQDRSSSLAISPVPEYNNVLRTTTRSCEESSRTRERGGITRVVLGTDSWQLFVSVWCTAVPIPLGASLGSTGLLGYNA